MEDKFVRTDESVQPQTYVIILREIVEFWDQFIGRQQATAGEQGVEHVLIIIELSEGLPESIRPLIALDKLLEPGTSVELRIEQQQEVETGKD